ncbi:MAG TPA: glycosyltransferase family 2 protein [Lacipirellulaceae bacterium]|nr:glycosyltransferase family 2 protein [Lacipirellulaceae bacterium]
MSAIDSPESLDETATFGQSLDRRQCVLSVVSSALNEAANVATFLEQTCDALAKLGISGEVIFIDDGSQDETGQIAADYALDHPDVPIRIVRHWRPRGLAAAIIEGAAAARGRYVCFLPADLESSPADDIPKLFQAMDADTDVVLGRRVGRADGKRVASGVYNLLNALLFGVCVRDGNWIKLIRTECLRGVRLHNDWHPFLVPILAHAGCRIKEVDTMWCARTYGQSKFGLNRFARAAAAAMSVKFHLTFGTRPMLFFFGTAALMTAIGTLLLVASFFVNTRGDRLFTALQMFSVGFYVAGWLSVTTGLVVDILNRQFDRTDK